MIKKKRRAAEPNWKKRPPGFDQALMDMVRAVRLFNKRNPQGRLAFTLSWDGCRSDSAAKGETG